MTLTRRKKKFAECIFRNPNREAVIEQMNITESNFNALFSDDEVIGYLETLYKKNKRIASITSYGAMINNVSEMTAIVSDPVASKKDRIAASKELRETHIQLQEHEVNARLIEELEALDKF